MAPTNGGGETNGNGGTGSATAINNQKTLLAAITANFMATPPTVQPFGTTTLSWNLTNIPKALPPVTAVFAGSPVKLQDSRTVTVAAATEFFLSAKTLLTSNVIATLTVQVDTSTCSTQSFPASLIQEQIKNTVQTFIPIGGDVKVHSTGINAQLDVNSLAITVPLTITSDGHHPTLDVTTNFFVAMSQTPNTIEVASTTADVNLNIQGIGGALCGQVAQDLSVVFVNVIAQLVAWILADQLTTIVQNACEAAHNQDVPNFRTFTLTSIVWDDTEFSFTICPEGSGAGSVPTAGMRRQALTSKSKIVKRKKQKSKKSKAKKS